MNSRIFHVVFACVVIGDLAGRLLPSQTLDLIFKPLIMLCLGVFFYFHAPVSRLRRLVLWAIFWAWAGDVWLMFEGALFFPLGLGSFLISHVFYIIAYAQSFQQHPFSLIKANPWLVLPFVALGTGVYWFLFDSLGVLQLPVLLYTTVLVLMSVFALNRYQKVGLVGFRMVFIGSLFFLISDMCLAINMFAMPIPFSGLVVMSTYMTAQYLIVMGLLK